MLYGYLDQYVSLDFAVGKRLYHNLSRDGTSLRDSACASSNGTATINKNYEINFIYKVP
jgi:hypothetical protein